MRTFTIWVTLPTILVYFGICALVLLVLQMMSDEMNAIDSDRGRNAIHAAIGSVVSGLGESATDEATWTEAYLNTYVDLNLAWLDSTWGSTARTSNNYDTVLVTDTKGAIIFGEGKQGPLEGQISDHLSGTAQMISNLEATVIKNGDDTPVSALARTKSGFSAVATAIIHGNTGQAPVPRAERRLLWLARRIDDELLGTTAEHFNLPRISVVEAASPHQASMELSDAAGTPVATIAWEPRRPGDRAFAHISTMAVVVLLLLGLLGSAVLLAFRSSIKSRQVSDERDWYSVRYDDITGLYNRFGLKERLVARLTRKVRSFPVAVLSIGLDGFTEVVGLYGREVSDQLLEAMADILESHCEESCELARTGSAEFMLVVCGEHAADSARAIAAKVLTRSADAIKVGDLMLKIGISIGLCEQIGERDAFDEILRHGETALARARETGGNHLVEYENAMESDRRRRLEVQSDIRRGLDAGEFDLEYQPIIDFATSSIIGVEALMRWPRRPGGPMSPGEFIPAAEASGLIEDLGMFALNRALEEIGPLQSVKISVNVSAAQLRNPNLPQAIFDTLQQWSVEAARLQLEVTETLLVAQPERAKSALEALRAKGITIALDDFGTGYSSIGYLRQFRFDRVKLDRSLVENIDRDEVQAALVESTMSYAFAMDLSVTAEGVERREEAVILSRLGCREFQGFLFARPMQLDQLRRLLTEQRQRQSELRQAS